TSNVGTKHLQKGTSLGFHRENQEEAGRRMKDDVMGELKHAFSPEFLNRIDEVVVFHALEKSHLILIVDHLLNELNKRLVERTVELEVSDEVKAWLIQVGYQPSFGARPLRRARKEHIGDPLCEDV